MATNKTYIHGVFITEKTFNDGGSILKVNIPQDKIAALAKQLDAAAVGGWTRLVISKLREPKVNANGNTIATHSLAVDDWQPNRPTQQPAAPRREPAELPTSQKSDDVPF